MGVAAVLANGIYPVLEDTGCLVGVMLCKVCLPWEKGLGCSRLFSLNVS